MHQALIASPARSPAEGLSEQTVHLAFVDALRGWALLSVLFVHIQTLQPLPARLAPLGQSANFGVQLFFVISALTLFMSYDSRRRRDRRPLAAFFVRRFFRIAPLFWLAIPTYLLFSGFGARDSAPDGIHLAQVLSTFLFLHGWHPATINAVVPGGWSIAVEMNFYLLLPLGFAVLTDLRRCVIACIGALGVSVVASIIIRRLLNHWWPPDLVQRFAFYWLPRQLPVFALGFLLFFLLKKVAAGDRPRPLPLLRRLPEVSVALLLASSLMSNRLPLAYFWFSCLFACLALGLSARPAAFLVNPVSRYIGKVSFSAYVVHFIVIETLGQRLGRLLADAQTSLPPLAVFALLYAACLIGTAALSTVTYTVIEEPGQNLGRLIIAKLGYGRAAGTAKIAVGG